jgi:predicted metal-dependent phosphotriesterase family hydrolase
VAPVEGFEVKSLRASATAQLETGGMINIHPSHWDNLLLENVRIMKEAGANLNRVVVSHVYGWHFTMDVIQELLDQGCCVAIVHRCVKDCTTV